MGPSAGQTDTQSYIPTRTSIIDISNNNISTTNHLTTSNHIESDSERINAIRKNAPNRTPLQTSVVMKWLRNLAKNPTNV